MTITAHVIDRNDTLQAYCLDTSQMKERHTSECLLDHILKKLKDFDLYKKELGHRSSEDMVGETDDGLGNVDYLSKEPNEEDKELESPIPEKDF